MLKAVIFDLDHTLYDRSATFAALAPGFQAHFCVHLPEALSLPALTRALQEGDTATCNKSNWPGMYELFKQRGVFQSDPGFEAFMDYMFWHFPENIVPYPDSYDILAHCRSLGLRTALITNGMLDFQNRKIEAMGLREKMDFCMVSCESGASKPDKTPFLYAADQLGIKPCEAVYVGDNPRNDVWGARNAGMQSVWFDVLHDWDASIEPAPTIHALCELKALLPELARIL